jgi:polysaccharide export outer membrane protein
MPVSSRVKLLAGVAALLGLCIAGSGCHPNLVQPEEGLFPEGYAAPVVASSPDVVQVQYAPVVSTTGQPLLAGAQTPPAKIGPPVVLMGRPRKKGLFERRTPAPGTGIQQASSLTGGTLSPADASALRPVPGQSGTMVANYAGPVQGAWPPAHHEVSDAPVSTEAPPLATIAGGPVPRGTPTTAGPPIPAKEAELPKPRPVFGTGPKKAPYYAELPAPGITHPPKAPREGEKRALSAYIVEPPDVLAIELTPDLNDKAMPITGPHLVRPDGTVGVGAIGPVFVAGMTLDDAKRAIAAAIFNRTRRRPGGKEKEEDKDKPAPTLEDFLAGLKVDVQAYNSKWFYVITDGGGYGAQVYRIPCTGNETVLDAIAQVQGLPAVSSPKKIWLARSTPAGHYPYILPVDFHAVVMAGSSATNYQVFPGDRLFVHSDPRIRVNSHLEKFLAPVDRVLGTMLLGTGVINSIKNGGRSGSGSGNGTGF